MKLNTESIRKMSRDRGLGLGELLKQAGVSRTAYYSLARREELLPASIRRLAKALDVSPESILLDEQKLAEEMRHIAQKAEALAAQHKGANPVKVLPLERIIVSKRATNRKKDRLALPILKDALIALKADKK